MNSVPRASFGRGDEALMCMRIYLLAIAFLSFAASANKDIGIPIGDVVDFVPTESAAQASTEIVIEGPFEGIFSVFERYRAHVNIDTGLLFMAEAEKLYRSFDTCANDTRRIWSELTQKYGKPARDENQAWWFNAGNRQKISLDCTIYGASGKIAMNMTVVDSNLARLTREEWEQKTWDRLQQRQ